MNNRQLKRNIYNNIQQLLENLKEYNDYEDPLTQVPEDEEEDWEDYEYTKGSGLGFLDKGNKFKMKRGMSRSAEKDYMKWKERQLRKKYPGK